MEIADGRNVVSGTDIDIRCTCLLPHFCKRHHGVQEYLPVVPSPAMQALTEEYMRDWRVWHALASVRPRDEEPTAEERNASARTSEIYRQMLAL